MCAPWTPDTAPQAQGWRRRGQAQRRGYDRPHGRLWAGRLRLGREARRGARNPFAALPIDKSIAKRERVLSDPEIAEIWRAAADATAPYGSIIRLLILTGQRRGEVAGMAWNEISEDLATWTLPGERTKNGEAHMVPLSVPARDLLRALLPKMRRKQSAF